MIGQLYKTAPVWLASIMKITAHLEVGFVFCWVITADVSGYHNQFIKLLSRPGFIRYAKRTYAMYLVAPIVTLMVAGLSRTEFTFNDPEIVSITFIWFYSISIYLNILSPAYRFVCNHEGLQLDFLSCHCTFWSSILQLIEMHLAKEIIGTKGEMSSRWGAELYVEIMKSILSRCYRKH